MIHVINKPIEWSPTRGPADLTELAPRALADDADLRRQWRSLLAGSWNPYGLYQSPEWFDHVLQTAREQLLPPLALLRGGHLDGLALPYRKQFCLPFEIRQYSLWTPRLRTVAFLGCEPLLPPIDDLHDTLFATTLAAAPEADAIYMHSVPLDGFLWEYLHRSPWIEQNFFLYLPQRIRRFHALDVPSNFDDFLATQFRKKKRYNLKRQLRVMEDEVGGLEWRRIEEVDDVGWFARAASEVVQHSWQSRWMLADTYQSLSHPAWLEDLARRKLLRSYVLLCGGKPRAMVLGYQGGDTFHYSETSYDESFAKYSPGGVLLYLLISDLVAHRPPRWLSFGTGDSRYKEEYANRCWQDASVLLIARHGRSARIGRAHARFRGAIDWAKRRYRYQSRTSGLLPRNGGE